MAFSTNLLLNEPPGGDPAQTNNWATMVNTNMSLLDTAVAGVLPLSITGGNLVLTSNAAAADQSRNAHFSFTGVLTSDELVLMPASLSRMFSVSNACTGAFTLVIGVNDGSGSAAAGDTVTVPQGMSLLCYSDGTNVNVRQLGFVGNALVVGSLSVSGLFTAAASAVVNGTLTGTAMAQSSTDHGVGVLQGTVIVPSGGSASITTVLNTVGTIVFSEQQGIGSAGWWVLYDNNNNFVGVVHQGPALSSGVSTITGITGDAGGTGKVNIAANSSGGDVTVHYKIIPFDR